MTKGWHHESTRHSLAARGIKSGRIKTRTRYVLDDNFNLTFEPVDSDDVIVKKDGKNTVVYYMASDESSRDIDDLIGDSMGELISFHRDVRTRDKQRGVDALDDDPYAVQVNVYSHGGNFWFLPGEGGAHEHDIWDTASPGGVWIPDDYLRKELDDLPKKDRKKAAKEYARQYLQNYNAIEAGEIYGIAREVFEPGKLDPISSDHVWGYVGHDWTLDEMKRLSETGGF